jgi:beta-lactamase regulating signal transducer with metallopeptidase domain
LAAWEPFAGNWLAWIAAASWQLAVLVLIVALVTLAARGASPRLRHALWLLVLAKVFLPPGLTTPLSVGSWALTPLLQSAGASRLGSEMAMSWQRMNAAPTAAAPAGEGIPQQSVSWTLPAILLVVWGAGCAVLWGVVGWRYLRLLHAMRAATPIDEGPLRVALERLAIELGVRRVPELFAASAVSSPFLFGVARPRIVLPEGSLGELDAQAIRAVLAHELIHWQRRDTWVGWAQVLAQGLFWFHPPLWWANAQLRHERECACDEAVLRLVEQSPPRYGETLVRVLAAARGRSLVAGSMVGVFERGTKLQDRLENIMSYEATKRGFGWPSRLALAVFALVFLPMGSSGGAGDFVAAADPSQESKYPQIVKTTPKLGATDVDPDLTELSIAFDRDMGQGMSWTGGGPDFPTIDETREAKWTDARTCVLPVKLAEGKFYRVGINSTFFQNFQAADGTPAPSSALYFVTKGANSAIKNRARAPKIVKFVPANGATDVDPKTPALRVTFDVAMGEGMSWTGDRQSVPKGAADKEASWSKDGVTCVLPVQLEPGREYTIGLNNLMHNNFQSKWGVPLEPVEYKLSTRAAK